MGSGDTCPVWKWGSIVEQRLWSLNCVSSGCLPLLSHGLYTKVKTSVISAPLPANKNADTSLTRSLRELREKTEVNSPPRVPGPQMPIRPA